MEGKDSSNRDSSEPTLAAPRNDKMMRGAAKGDDWRYGSLGESKGKAAIARRTPHKAAAKAKRQSGDDSPHSTKGNGKREKAKRRLLALLAAGRVRMTSGRVDCAGKAPGGEPGAFARDEDVLFVSELRNEGQ